MITRAVRNFFNIMIIFGMVPVVEANARMRWVLDQGFPVILTYKDSKYCYGEIEDLLSDKKVEILCRATHDGKCPAANDCYAERAVNGVIL